MLEPFKFYNKDCMIDMVNFKDNEFDLAIVDPPYGINASYYIRGGTQYGKSKAKAKKYDLKNWDSQTIKTDYVKELFRISKNQILFGANHYISKIPYDSSCWIVWDKNNGEGSGYADCELAWSSFKSAVRRFRWRWAGMLQEDMKNKEFRIHPTQKPVALYRWLLQNYAKPNDTILDTHVGSGSSIIACLEEGFDITGYEIDKDYYDSATKRIEIYKSQIKLDLK